MSLVQISCNRNNFLIEALKKEGILSDGETIVADEDTETFVSLYEGRDHYYFEIWRHDIAVECIVPKVVPKEIATDMVLYKEFKDDVGFMMFRCEDDRDFCIDQCKEELKLEWVDEEEYQICVELCEKDYSKCVGKVESTEVYKAWKDAQSELSKNKIMLIGCFSGSKVGHPDIDEVCVFRL